MHCVLNNLVGTICYSSYFLIRGRLINTFGLRLSLDLTLFLDSPVVDIHSVCICTWLYNNINRYLSIKYRNWFRTTVPTCCELTSKYRSAYSSAAMSLKQCWLMTSSLPIHISLSEYAGGSLGTKKSTLGRYILSRRKNFPP